MTMFDLRKYWDRIGFIPREGESREEQLIRVHRCHSQAIPFENFTVFCGQPVTLDTDAIFDKIVCQPRGGYCFEMNQLFCDLLVAMGYAVTPVGCRPITVTGETRPLTHRINLVELNGRIWVCDVGLGTGGWTEPLLLETGRPQIQGDETFVIEAEAHDWFRVDWSRGERSRSVLRFPLAAAQPGDFVMANYFLSTRPDSVFTQSLMCKRPDADGRMFTIHNNHFRIDEAGMITETDLTPDNFEDILKKYFGIVLPGELAARVGAYLGGFGK